MEHVFNCTGYEMLIENVTNAEGYYLYDSKGKKYIDFESGVWSISIGHSNQELNNTIFDQAGKIMHLGFRYSSQLVEMAAKDVIETLDSFNGKCVFLCSGSEAVELAVKAAKHIVKDKMLLTFDLSYLSAYGQSGTKNDKEWYKLDLKKCIECSGKEGCSVCDIVNEIPFSRIGVFVFEPGNSSGLVLLPPKELIQEIVKRVKADDGIIVVDEVTTGVGRTGKWYGFQHYDIKPDIVAMGKGIGNGYPISVVAIDDKVAELLEINGFRHSQSHQNDALGCAVVSKVIRIIKDNELVNKSSSNGKYLMQRLCELESKTDVIKEVRGIGMMIGIEFVSDANIILKETFDYLLEKGIIVGYNPKFNFMRFYPTLTTSIADIEYLLSCLEEALLD
ncbi:MAG: aspartate aminotransferase family protein [Clostridia bacterium]|jgi:acetylornithine aminotransferase|nr:aspartate aminotransferase family protein [Clostridia bacterium]